MSSTYLYDNETPARRAFTEKSLSNKNIKRLLVALAFVVGAQLIWIFGISPCMPLSRVEVKGIPGLDSQSMIALAGIGTHSSFMTVNSQSAEEALLSHPLVHAARVIKHFPGRVEIVLQSRRAAVMALIENSGRIQPVLIDGRGVVFNVGKEGFDEQEALPVLSGIVLEGVSPGMKLPRIYSALFGQLETLATEAPELLGAVSEIRINQKKYDGFDLTLYPSHTPIKVRVGPDLTEDTLRYMLLMLDVLSTRADYIEELDFRTGTASYKLKEAYSG
jgi:cell division protein FtsQ